MKSSKLSFCLSLLALWLAGGEAPAQSYSIGGVVTDSTNGTTFFGVSGVTVTAKVGLSTNGQSAVTAANGDYTITNLDKDVDYGISPAKTGDTFSPASYSIEITSTSPTGVNFSVAHTISGQITMGGTGLSGVTVTAGSESATTDTNGNYTISGLPAGTITNTPSLVGYFFVPPSQNVPLGPNATNINFTAYPDGIYLAGQVTSGTNGVSGVSVMAGTNVTTTSSNGYYSFSNLVGTLSVLPSLSAYFFVPPSQNVSLGLNTTNVNFNAYSNGVYIIGGQVTSGTNGVSGVTVAAGTNLTSTDSNGYYSFSFPISNQLSTFVVTPSNGAQVFNPQHQALSIPPSITNINFVQGVSNITTIFATCDQPSLVAAVALGGLVEFGANGDLLLTNQLNITNNLVLNGTNHTVTLDGGGTTRIAYINPYAPDYVNTNIQCTMANLTISNGLGQLDTVHFSPSIFPAGGVGNFKGNLSVIGCTFISNTCVSVGNPASNAPAPECCGGAIFSFLGSLSINNSSFISNTCTGGSTIISNSPSCVGGAIFIQGGPFSVTGSSFIGNSAFGNGTGGGAILGDSVTTASISGSLFNQNFCVTDSTWGYPLGGYGLASGGAINTQTGGVTISMAVVNCTFASNTVRDLNTQNNNAAGNTIDSVNINGGVSYLNLTNCTFKNNTTGSNVFQDCLVVPSITNSTTFRGCILEDATPAGWSYELLEGSITDLGFNMGSNLLSTNNAVYFTNSTSRSGVNTMLSPVLTQNGGPTMTFNLLPGSPCIDAITNGYYPQTDQRGFIRPYGKAADSGAVEYYPSNFTINSLTRTNTNWTVHGYGFPLTAFQLLSSTNLTNSNWSIVQTNATGSNGLFSILDTSSNVPRRFYRTAVP